MYYFVQLVGLVMADFIKNGEFQETALNTVMFLMATQGIL
jgi:hypothetical protein